MREVGLTMVEGLIASLKSVKDNLRQEWAGSQKQVRAIVVREFVLEVVQKEGGLLGRLPTVPSSNHFSEVPGTGFACGH